MTERPRYYLTTAIAYANAKPGVHTLYEVIGADVVARWHRMKGDDTRFLTGTDEHSINIAQAAVDEGRPAREFVDEKVGYFKVAEDALAIAPDRFIRTTDPDHVRAAQEMVRRAHANGDIYLGTYEGWYCPNEGFRNATDVQETARGTICPNHPDVPLQWLTEKNWFFRLSAYQERLERHFADHPEFVQPDFRRNEMLGFIRGGLEDFSISRERTPGGWGIPFPIAENGESAQREDGSWDPEAGVIYVWYDALINYITGAGFPDDQASFARWWPADLHVIGKDIARFHTIFWPAMLWSAGLEAPRRVWVHGWLMAAGGERMSKSRGNFLDPERLRGRVRHRRGALRRSCGRSPFDRDAEVSWDSFVRRYNADLANDFGNLVNRTVSMTKRYLQAVRPVPRTAWESPLGDSWPATARPLRRGARGVPAARRARRAVGLRRPGEPAGRRREAVGPRQGLEGRRPGGRRSPARRARRPRRDVPARRPGRRAVPAGDGAADPGAARLHYPYGDDGNGGPPSSASSGGAPAANPAAWPSPSRCSRGWRSRPRWRRGRNASLSRRRAAAPDRLTAPVRLDRLALPRQCRPLRRRRRGCARCRAAAGVERILVPGWNVASSARALDLVARLPWLDAAVGVHPHDAAKVDDAGWRTIEGWATDDRVVAIGETGLDYDRVFSPIPDQLTNLRRNLRLAAETGKPAILHCRSAAGRRDAQDALLDELQAMAPDAPPIVIH